MKSFSITDIGMKRTMNQDYVYNEEKVIGNLPNLFIVADGMGGHKAGDFASRFCVEKVVEHVKNNSLKTPVGILEEAIKNTNELLIEASKEKSDYDGMGTTFVAATIFEDVMYVANVGDSRLYVINNQMKQVTVDHSLVEEMIKSGEIDRTDARLHPNKNIITKALGANKYINADYFEINIKKEDIVLMCSDGLTNMIEDEEIFHIVKENASDLKSAANKLVNIANDYGGIDNIAIILIKL